MLLTDPGLGRRIQLQQGIVWLAAVQGDPWAALLRGIDADPRAHWQRLAERPLHRSATGAWVTARHSVAAEAAAEPALRELPLLAGFEPSPTDGAPRGRADAAAGADDPLPHLAPAWRRALANAPVGADGTWDVVAAARAAALGALALAWGLDDREQQELDAAAALTDGLADAPCYPQNLPDTRRIARGVAALRALPAVGGSDRRLLLAATGVRMAADLVTGTLVRYPGTEPRQELDALWERLRTRPDDAARAVAETLRWAGPVQLRSTVAQEPCELAGQRIEPGEQVAVLIGAANRDASVFADPDRYDPDRYDLDRCGLDAADRDDPASTAPAADPLQLARAARVVLPGAPGDPVLSFAAAAAREGLHRLAELRPRPDGGTPAAPRRPAAPVSRSLPALTVRTPQS